MISVDEMQSCNLTLCETLFIFGFGRKTVHLISVFCRSEDPEGFVQDNFIKQFLELFGTLLSALGS